MTRGEIEATTSTPYMGFNHGSTKARQYWDGAVTRHYFESPLVRLLKDYDHEDAYLDGRVQSPRIPRSPGYRLELSPGTPHLPS